MKHDCRQDEGAVDGSIRHNCQFEVDTFWDAQTVKADERWGNLF